MTDGTALTRKQFLGGAAAAGLGLAVGGRIAPTAKAVTASAAAKRPFLIGMPIAMSGPVVRDQRDHLEGTTLAVEEINAVGGVGGRKIATFVTDVNPFDPASITTSFQRLVGKKVDAITSPFVAIPPPAMDVAGPYGCPYLNGDTSSLGNDLVRKNPKRYGNRFSDAAEVWYGKFLPRFLDAIKTRGWKPSGNTVHIVESDVVYTQTISAEAQKAIQATGGRWRLAAVDKITTPTTDWGPIIAKLHDTNPAVVMISHFVASDEAAFAKQFVANPTNSLVYLQYAPSQPEFLEIAGSAANGFVWSTLAGIVPTPEGKAFEAAYRRRWKRPRPKPIGVAYTAFGYDSVKILSQAWQVVGDPRNFKAVNDFIRRITYRGVLGTYTFRSPDQTWRQYPDQIADPTRGVPHIYYQVQNGQHRVIAPVPFVEARYVTPQWAS